MQRIALIIVMVAAIVAGADAGADETPPPGPVQAPPPGLVQAPPSGPVQAPPPESVIPPPTSTAVPPPQQNPAEPPPLPTIVQPPLQSAVQSVAPEAAEAILGQRVTDADNADVGRLVDVLVDATGQPQAAVIDFGGFMGVGSRKIAVHWSALRFSPGDSKHKVTLEMTPDQIKAAPEFLNPNKAAPVVTPANIAPASP